MYLTGLSTLLMRITPPWWSVLRPLTPTRVEISAKNSLEMLWNPWGLLWRRQNWVCCMDSLIWMAVTLFHTSNSSRKWEEAVPTRGRSRKRQYSSSLKPSNTRRFQSEGHFKLLIRMGQSKSQNPKWHQLSHRSVSLPHNKL